MKNTSHETVYIYSMGKKLKIIAIFTNEQEANDYMEKNDRAAVIACYGDFIFLADKYDNGIS